MAMKVVVVYGTRPEAVKLAPVCRVLTQCPDIVYRGINTGQHLQLMPSIMERFGVPAALTLNLMQAGQSLLELEARILRALPEVWHRESPDVVLVQGDTASAIMGAWAAFHEGIPVAHVESGLRTYRPQSPFPEETFRRCIATFSAWNFAPSLTAAQNLMREAVPGRIIVTGNPVVDALQEISRWKLPPGIQLPPKVKRYRVLATIHRRENYPYLHSIFTALDTLARDSGVELFLPLHPNPVVVAAAHEWLTSGAVHIIEPMDYDAWIHFMMTADLIVSDSGGIQEEAPILGVPVLVVREETERPEIIAGNHGMLVGHDSESIISSARESLSGRIRFHQGNPYGDGHAAQRIAHYLVHPNDTVDPATGHPHTRYFPLR